MLLFTPSPYMNVNSSPMMVGVSSGYGEGWKETDNSNTDRVIWGQSTEEGGKDSREPETLQM